MHLTHLVRKPIGGFMPKSLEATMKQNLFELLERNSKTTVNSSAAKVRGATGGSSNRDNKKAAQTYKAIQALEGATYDKDVILFVHPSELMADPNQPRGEVIDNDDIAQLAREFETTPILHPIACRPPLRHEKDLSDQQLKEPGVDKFRIIAGERRWRASMLAGLDRVPIRVFSDLSDLEVVLLQGKENKSRKDLKPSQWAKYYARLASEFGMSSRQIQAELGGDHKYAAISEYIKMSKDKNILDALDNGDVVVRQARHLTAIPNEKDRIKAIREVKKQRDAGRVLSADEVQSLVHSIIGKERIIKPPREQIDYTAPSITAEPVVLGRREMVIAAPTRPVAPFSPSLLRDADLRGLTSRLAQMKLAGSEIDSMKDDVEAEVKLLLAQFA